MKAHMLIQLNSRYSKAQLVYLTQCTFLDPRFKKSVNLKFNEVSFIDTVTEIAISHADEIPDTPTQSLKTISSAFSNPQPYTSKASTGRSPVYLMINRF